MKPRRQRGIASSDEGISTDELVRALGRRGLDVSAQALRMDVRRGLIAPRMPASGGSGRGVPERWTPMAVRRAVYTARLRRRGVNGRVLPLLLFVFDGWGWDGIQPAVIRSLELNLAAELKHQLQIARSEDPPSQDAALRSARDMRAALALGHAPPSGATLAPYMTRALFGVFPDGAPPGDVNARGELQYLFASAQQTLQAGGISIPDSLAFIRVADGDAVATGHAFLRALLLDVRRMLLQWDDKPNEWASTNPLTLCGLARSAGFDESVRRTSDRETPGQVLASLIALAVCATRFLDESSE